MPAILALVGVVVATVGAPFLARLVANAVVEKTNLTDRG